MSDIYIGSNCPGLDIFLQPGEWYFGGPEACVRTTLGSCVAFTFWHRRLCMGGICHYMLSRLAAERRHGRADGRYADEALELLSGAARAQGTDLRDYEVKLFGGADMFKLPNRPTTSVGACNIEAAFALVQHHGLHVTAQSLGGTRYRQLMFAIGSGDVWLRHGAASSQLAPGAPVAGGLL